MSRGATFRSPRELGRRVIRSIFLESRPHRAQRFVACPQEAARYASMQGGDGHSLFGSTIVHGDHGKVRDGWSGMALSRSEQMARIRGRDTKPEALLRRVLWARGLRYRLHIRVDGARPDLVFKGARVAVFVDGCFWHGCPDHYVRPRSRDRFWREKLLTNVERDVRQTLKLEQEGWRVCRLWEHEVFEDPEGAAKLVESAIRSPEWRPKRSWRTVRVDALGGSGDMERRHLRELREHASRRVDVRKRSTKKWKNASTQKNETSF